MHSPCRILGDSNANLPKIVEVCVKVRLLQQYSSGGAPTALHCRWPPLLALCYCLHCPLTLHLTCPAPALRQVLAKGDKLVEPEAAQQMAGLLKQMQAALPAEVFQGFVAALKPKQQQRLQEVLAG